MSSYLRVFCAKVFERTQKMIDITGYLAVQFTVMMMIFFFFFPFSLFCFFVTIKDKQSHPNTTLPWHVTETGPINKPKKEMLPFSRWETMMERKVYDYSEQHPPFVHFFSE